MKTIRQRITAPLFWSAILLPVAILLAFNVIIRFYFIANVRQDLQATSSMMTSLARQAGAIQGDAGKLDDLPQTLRQRLDQLRIIMRAASQVNNIDILVISQDGRILYPADKLIDLPDKIKLRLTRQVISDIPEDEVATIRSLTGEYLYIKTLLADRLPDRSPWIVCLSRYSPMRGVQLAANLILLVILAAGSLISMRIVSRTADRISQPLRQLANVADQLGSGVYPVLENSDFCEEINRLQKKLHETATRLSQADHVQKTFLQDASHELRTPLMVIQGYAEGLEQGVFNDAAGTATVIKAESKKLSQLVDSLLTLSRIENQAGRAEQVRLDLKNWLQDQAGRMQSMVRSMGKELHLSVADGIHLVTNEALLEQAVRNILSNAVRYAAGLIKVTAGQDHDKIWIKIQDDGPGISPEDFPHLFDRFYKGKGGQYGLGLAIAKSAAEAVGGELTAENDAAGGAVFIIWLRRSSQ